MVLPSGQAIILVLVGVNGLVYALAIIGIIKQRSMRIPANPTVEQAFKILEASLKSTFPDLPEGYTWREVMVKLRALNLDIDWWEVENTFKKYEDYRYGGIEYKNANAKAIMKLALSLPRGEKHARVS